MRSFHYPVRLKRDEAPGALNVTFRDFPEAITWGQGTEDALIQAADCLEEAIAGRIRRGDDIPMPSALKRGEHLIPVPAMMAAKAALYLAIRESGLDKSLLARRLKRTEVEVRRMLDPKHATKVSELESALRVLGKRLTVGVDAAA